MFKELCDKVILPTSVNTPFITSGNYVTFIISVKINWSKRVYPLILEEFKDNLSDFILAG